jgi:hypothetical protein
MAAMAGRALHNPLMVSKSLTLTGPRKILREKAGEAILGLVVKVPTSREPGLQDRTQAILRSQAIAHRRPPWHCRPARSAG